MRIYYLLLFSFFLLFNGKVWTTKDLITYAEENENSIAPEGKEYYIIDPENFFTSEQKNTLFSYMEEIDNKHGVKIILIILKEITTAYETITEFGTKFTQLLVYNSAKRDFYITVTLRTSTKDYGISTFPSADLVFPDKFMKNVISAVRSKMNTEQYFEMCKKMLGYFKDLKDPGKKGDTKTGIIIGIVLGSILGVALIYAIIAVIIKVKHKKIMEKMQIEIIDKIKNKEITAEYFNTHCILCFKEMNNNSSAPPCKEVEVIQVQHAQGASEEIRATNLNLCDNNQKKKETDPEDLTTLPCGHKYHTECFDKWYERDTICPKCRERLDGLPVENNMQLGYHVMNIQLSYLPFAKDYIYDEQTFKIIIVNKISRTGRYDDSFEDVVPDKKK